MQNNKKWIFHIDFDSYFVNASITQLPQLKNKPVVICHKNYKSIILSASYDLKAKGIKIGVPLYKAKKIEPGLIVIKPKLDYYKNLSSEIFEYIALKYSRLIEVYSIDECWIDMSYSVNNSDQALKIGQKIQKDILERFGIPLSIGISHNNFLSKMTTNQIKPFKVAYTAYKDIEKRFYHLDISKCHGIGKSTEKTLRSMNINTIGQLAQINTFDPIIKDKLGILGWRLIEEVKGLGKSQIKNKPAQFKNIGKEITFIKAPINDKKIILEYLKTLAHQVSIRLKNRNLVGNIVYLLFRNSLGTWISKRVKINEYICEQEQIYSYIYELLEQHWNDEALKGVGLRVSNLKNKNVLTYQMNLFDEKINSSNKVQNIIEEINFKIGKEELNTLEKIEQDKSKNMHQNKFLIDDVDF